MVYWNTIGVRVHSLCVGHFWCLGMLLECGNAFGVWEYFWCMGALMVCGYALCAWDIFGV